jgi:hypothetical protein
MLSVPPHCVPPPLIVGTLGTTFTVDVFTPVTADWQVTPPATVNRTVAVFAPVVDVLNV